VELRLVAGDADRFCRFIAGHGLILGAHEPVQLATYGIGQHTDTCDIPVEVLHRATFHNGQMS
jgi:hypothetical protein